MPHVVWTALIDGSVIVIGFGVSLGFGHVLVAGMDDWLDEQLNVEPGEDEGEDPALDPEIVGFAERLFFTAGFALATKAAFGLAGVWVVAKMAANWMARPPTRWVRGHRMKALVLGLVSMSLALAGGLIIRVWV